MLRNIKPKLGNRGKFFVEILLQTVSPFSVLLLSLVGTGLAWHYTAKAVERDSKTNFKLQVSEAKNSLDFHIKTYINILQASQGLFAASQSVERDEWKAFVQSLNLPTLYRGIKGMGFIRYVPNSRKASYEKQVRLDTSINPNGYPDFAIKPAVERPAYFVIEYIEPFPPNRPAFGLDINSKAVRRAAAGRARDTGQAAATRRIVIVQDATKQPGVLILLPLYRYRMPHSTVEEKRRALLGFIYAPLEVTALIEEALPKAREQGLELEVYNGKDLMYDSERHRRSFAERVQQFKKPNLQPLHQETTLDVAGETWQLYFTSHRANKILWKPTPILVLGGGTLISLLLWGIMRSLTSSRQRAFGLATRMTAELSLSNVALQNSQLLLDGVLNSSLDGVMAFKTLRDCQDKIVDFQWLLVNPASEKMIGRTSDELIGKHLLEEMPGNREEGLFALYIRVVETGEPLEREFYYEHDGIEAWFLITAVKLEDGFAVTFRDISERKRTEEQIAASLTEKEILLKEVHHRVKNNLQVIDSLFRHQCRHIKEPKITQILKECQNRVSSMALLHEKLYQSKDLAHIDLAEYFQSLVANLYDSYRINGTSPTLKIDVKPIFIELEIALTCGLIINELVSNCLKYAFPKGKMGYLQIQFLDDEKGNFTLIVKDNGIGLPKDFSLEKTNSLGLKLVKSFVRQLLGTIEVNTDKGTEFTIIFKVNSKSKKN